MTSLHAGDRQRLSLIMELSIHCYTALVLETGCKLGYLIPTYNHFHYILRFFDVLPNLAKDARLLLINLV